jgi:hypothetical protein
VIYIAIVKNDNDSWDAIFKFNYASELRINMLNDAWEKGLPITGMATTGYGLTPKIGAIWNGTEFSGGHERGTADFPAINIPEEQLANMKSYSFICDNEVVATITAEKDTPQSEMLDAAFAGEVYLVKQPETLSVMVGDTLHYDKDTRALSS